MSKRFNYYGKWVFVDNLGLGHNIKEGDVVTITRKEGDMVFGAKEDGTPIMFHCTNLTKHYFVRPSTLVEK